MKFTAIATAALALALPLAAHAEATSTSSFSNFRYEVIDLDLNDGIAAALTLEDAGIVLAAGYYPSVNTPPEPFDYHLGEGSVNAAIAAGNSTAALANGSANLSSAFNGTAGEMFSSAVMGHYFSLTANTKLVLHADASVSSTFDATRHGYSHAELFISYLDGPQEVDETTLWDSLTSHAGSSASRALTLSLSTGATGLDGNLGVAAGTFATVSAVPEPSQYAMFGLGLAGMCWRLRRARRA